MLIPKGFYNDIKKVLVTLEAALLRVVGKPKLRVENRSHMGREECWHMNSVGCEISAKLQKEYVLKAFQQIVFQKQMSLLEFTPNNASIMRGVESTFKFSEDLGHLFGFPLDQRRVHLHPDENATVFAPDMV